jgi:hypothetical protein
MTETEKLSFEHSVFCLIRKMKQFMFAYKDGFILMIELLIDVLCIDVIIVVYGQSVPGFCFV